ncbi:MAG: hypothetical protein RI544_04655 [Haloquadratum sp.]|nr:hypothetical protein [Haloferacaceae archaeon]MDR9445433.1 hypothetical protein [Haloquadratum sp.]
MTRHCGLRTARVPRTDAGAALWLPQRRPRTAAGARCASGVGPV